MPDDPKIEAAAKAVEDLKADIAKFERQMVDGGKEVADKFEEVYGSSED